MVGGGWLRLAVVSCGVSWEREKDDGCSHAAGAADLRNARARDPFLNR